MVKKVLIEPQRNWNKHCALIYSAIYCVLIEPQRNWNLYLRVFIGSVKVVLIEPQRNWNRTAPLNFITLCNVLIEPQRNWNLITKPETPVSIDCINRTSKELKQAWYLGPTVAGRVLIEPQRNWNRFLFQSLALI